MYLRKSNICSLELDVHEAHISIHSSTKSEIISLDGGLRMDGILCSRSLGRGFGSVTFNKRHCKTK